MGAAVGSATAERTTAPRTKSPASTVGPGGALGACGAPIIAPRASALTLQGTGSKGVREASSGPEER
jgi:hypothetical protein